MQVEQRHALATELQRHIEAFHDGVPQGQGETGDGGTAGKALCQWVYDNAEAICAGLTSSVLAESTSNDCLLVAEGWQDEAGLADQGCRIPPNGWHCTRERGHDGPCAAHRVGRPLGAGWSPVPQGEATHDERLTDDELSALGLGVSEWAYKHLARGYAVSLSVREIKRLIAALSRTPAVTDLSGVGVG